MKEKASALKGGLDELVYRSNLLGSDRSVCNWGGGNTSMKTTVKDFRGRDIEVMWVKGSGSDLGDDASEATLQGCVWKIFAPLDGAGRNAG